MADPSCEATHAEVAAFLSDSRARGLAGPVTRYETHGAIVFVSPSDALKIKRPVRYAYLDFSTLEQRRLACRREHEINHPEAPDIYLGVVPITREADGRLAVAGHGTPVEWAVHMARFEQSDVLASVASSGPLTRDIAHALADAVVAYHARAPIRRPPAPTQAPRGLIAQLTTAFDAAPACFAEPHALRFAADASKILARAGPCLDIRAAHGFVRRCHGDLHLKNIILWKGRPRLIDALEFDEDLASVDTLYDLAFLVMDLDRSGQRAAANTVLNRYLWRNRQPLDLDGLVAMPLFLALRAGIRAMVAEQLCRFDTAADRSADAAKARDYLDHALAYLAPAPPRLIAIGGASGTGKSTLARALAPDIGATPGAVHLASDLERKALFAVEPTTRLGAEGYTEGATQAVYEALYAKAARALGAGHAVVADAVFWRPEERANIAAVASRLGVPFAGLWLTADPDRLHARVDARRGDASDATRAIVDQQLSRSAGTITWERIDAGQSTATTLAAARRTLSPQG